MKIANRNKSEMFKITNEEYNKVLMYMEDMGITNKSEYFRLCILNPPRILRAEGFLDKDN